MNRFESQTGDGATAGLEAWDSVFRRKVAIKRFPRSLDPHGSGARLQQAWDRWISAPHPGLLRPGLLDFREGHLVREWVEGFSLLELLRHRRKLEAAEAMSVLAAAAPILDHAAGTDLLTGMDLDRWFIKFHAVATEEIARCRLERIDSWPAWSLKFDPICISDLSAAASDQTAGGGNGSHSSARSAVIALHTLLHELLGRPKVRAGTPLPGLGDTINNLLPRAFESGTVPIGIGVRKCADRRVSQRLALALFGESCAASRVRNSAWDAGARHAR